MAPGPRRHAGRDAPGPGRRRRAPGSDGDLTWIRARAGWVHQLDIRQLTPPRRSTPCGRDRWASPACYAWAWEDEAAGRLRSRYFPTDIGIVEDEATGAAAVVMGDRLGRPLTIRQGVGSELLVRPDPAAGTVDVGGTMPARRRPGSRAGRVTGDGLARRDWDAIVVGLGGIGSGAAYWLSRVLGDGVLGLEQFELGHDRGASADHSRIIRLLLSPARLRPPGAARL